MSNALDEALRKLGSASNALERHKPNIKDVDEAKKAAKDAAEILDSAHKLMLRGIYSVADAPADAYNDPVEHQIYLPVVAESSDQAPVEPLPLPDDLLAFDTWSDEDQINTFERRLDVLRACFSEDTELDWDAWDSAWEAGPKDAFTRLLVAEAREPKSWDVPTDKERDAWLAQFAPEEVPTPGPGDFLNSWEGWTDEERKAQFDLQVEALTNLHATTDQAEPLDVLPFLEIYSENPFWAFCSILFCLAQEPVLFTYPDAQDVAVWAEAFTPASAEEEAADLDQEDATFDAKLNELEEHGVKEFGLKRKAWGKAEKAWRDSYQMARGWTLEALVWRLAQTVITWDVPTPEEMEAAS